MMAAWIRVNTMKKLYLIRQKINKTTKIKLIFIFHPYHVPDYKLNI